MGEMDGNGGNSSPANNSSNSIDKSIKISNNTMITNTPTPQQLVARSNNISITNIKCEEEIDCTRISSSNTNSIMTNEDNMLVGTSTTNNITNINSSGNCNNSNNSMNNSINSITETSNYFNGSSIDSLPKVEDSDESESELTNIENLKVNRRLNNEINKNVPRPMSWEGELSETEDLMDTENSVSNSGDNRFMETSQVFIKDKKSSINSAFIKPECDQAVNDISSVIYSTNNSKKIQQSDIINYKCEAILSDPMANGLNSPLLARSKANLLPANPSPDSAIHSVYTHSSPSQSPLTSRHAPYTPSLSRNNSDASHSSCYSYSSEFSPTHSPIQGRHSIYAPINGSLHHSVLYRPIIDNNDGQSQLNLSNNIQRNRNNDEVLPENDTIPSTGISRQQLINSPCPICGDKISGFHYGIFSCESCKGFFKRTVQNRKNYVCVRGGPCPVTITTRKKCPACRFDKCLQKGMKLEAIREDRTRGGRSTYQCSYTLPSTVVGSYTGSDGITAAYRGNSQDCNIKCEQIDVNNGNTNTRCTIPKLLQEIMDVEHLWQYTEGEIIRLNQQQQQQQQHGASGGSNINNLSSNPLLASAGLSQSNGDGTSSDIIANLCNVADHRLYKIVKWCKSLPLFKHISIDDQICLLINSWCELLLFSCCYRSITTPGEIKISLGKSITLAQVKSNGLQACIERMLNLTDHLRRLRIDRFEYVAMKVIVLLQSDTSELREPVKVRESQEKALQALQSYTISHYPESPAKFGELLLRIPELQRTCQFGKEMLTIRSKDGEDFNLLMELLRGEH